MKKSTDTNNPIHNYIFGGVSSLVFIYLIIRAVLVPPAMDEVTTFFFYIQPGSFQPHYAFLDANNHLLNSLLGHLCYLLLGEGMIVIRIPNLIGYIIYAYYGFKLFKMLSNVYAKITLIVLLFCTQYIVEFFAVSRGYGLSFAFLLGVFYHLIKIVSDFHKRDFYWGILLNILMILANLSLISWSPIFFILFITVVIIKGNIKKNYPGILIASLVYFSTFIYLFIYVWALKKEGSLYLWGGHTFYEVIFLGLSKELGLTNLTYGLLITIPLLIVWLLSFLLNIKRMRSPEYILFGLFICFNLGFILARHLLNTNYPPFRTGIQIYLVLILGVIHFVEKNKYKIMNFIFLIPGIYISIFFACNLNTTHVVHWEREAIPVSFADTVVKMNQQETIPLSVSLHNHEFNTWNYYNYLYDNHVNQANMGSYPNFASDLVLLTHRFEGTVPDHFDTIAQQLSTKHYLVINKKRSTKYHMVKVNDIECKDEYKNIHEFKLDSIHPENIKIGVSFELYKAKYIQPSYIVVRADSSKGNDMFYLKYLRSTEGLIKLSLTMKLSKADRSILLFVWNPRYENLVFRNITVYLENTEAVVK